jgi:hypothetical protein
MDEIKEYYITLIDQTFKAVVKNNYDRYNKISNTSIKIGGQYEACVNIVVFYDEIENPTFARIPWIESHPECGLMKSLEDGSSPKMIKAALQFTNDIFPTVTEFKFNDMSHIDCKKKDHVGNSGERMQMSLKAYYISIYNQTWYEKHFGAKLINTTFHNKYREALKKLYSPKIKSLYTWYSLKSTIGLQINKSEDDILEPLFLEADTFNTFFNLIPKETRCVLINGWIETLLQELLGNIYDSNNWYININGFTKIPIKIKTSLEITSSFQEGGLRSKKRKTRKNVSDYIYKIIPNRTIL